jgi:type IV pilus assembly protein PilN
MRLPINLSTDPLETHRRFLTMAYAGIVTTAILLLGLSWQVIAHSRAQSAYHKQMDASLREITGLEQQRAQLEHFFAKTENTRLHDRAAFVNSIIDARSFNWTRMFLDLERVMPNGVRVLSIEPKQVNGHAAVKLTVGADSEDAERGLLQALEKSDAFSHVELSSVHAPTQANGGDQVIVELTMEYSRA